MPIVTEGPVNISTSTSKTWTYGVNQTQADTRSYAFPVNVPPYTSLKVKAIVTMYDLSISYTITLRGISSGKLITENEKWNGVKARNIDYQILDNSSSIVKSINGTPSSIVYIKYK